MSWNCRIVHYADDGYGVHEVFYEDDRITGWSAAPALALLGERPELIREQVLAMLDDALAKPVLEESAMPGYSPPAGTAGLLAKAKALVDMLDDAERNHGALIGSKTLTAANELRLELSRWK